MNRVFQTNSYRGLHLKKDCPIVMEDTPTYNIHQYVDVVAAQKTKFKSQYREEKPRIMSAVQLLMFVILASTLSLVAPLANCPSACQCDDDTLVVRCGEGHLDVLPIALNPSILRLVIKNNKIKTIDSSIQFYSELGFLDLSYNHLFNIPPRTFFYQKKLQELHLNHNKIGSISNKTFTGLIALTVLNLRGNFLDELSAGVFSTLPKLEELNIGQNRIARIDPNAFEGILNLRVLFLDDNTLTSVPSPSFAHIPSIAELYLDNRLQRIPTAELSSLLRLEDLSLGQNEFVVIPENAFKGLTNLRRLDITGSLKLTQIQAGAFTTNTNLESITFASNKVLVEVQEGALSGLPHLKHVILRDNQLTTLAEGLFPWSELETFDLTENPVTCDCRVVWLRNLLASRNISQTQETVVCAAPDALKHQSLKEIREVLKGRYGNSALGRKEREYQKTFSDEDYMTRNPHPCSLSVHPALNNYPHHPNIRPIPVTEL
ncbi:Chondroadherin [Pseudolycoriella hygida]|uniref:Chondroadherin n=1 Tax=Pseudolycoriella hygida TaxID=35572 RepID=A0A9Q0NC35_9DIPT|nr:Chondroadherin [Pseudolycoriella hygida]